MSPDSKGNDELRKSDLESLLQAIHELANDAVPASFLVSDEKIVAYQGSFPCGNTLSFAGSSNHIDDIENKSIRNLFQRLQLTIHEAEGVAGTSGRISITRGQSLEYRILDSDRTPPMAVAFIRVFDVAEGQSQPTRTELELALGGDKICVWHGNVEKEDWIDSSGIESMLGLKRNELGNSRKRVRARIHPDDYHINERERVKHLSGGYNVSEVRIKDVGGRYRWFRIVGESAKDTDGNVISLAGTMMDIDDLKTAQLKLAEQVKRRDEFLAMLSHELRNPMAAITSSADYVKATGTLPAELQRFFDIISRQTEHMSRLMNDLLDVARITSNKIEIEKSIHDLSSNLELIVASAAAVFEKRNQKFTFNKASSPIILSGDAARLKQAFSNLLDNASKYTPPGGEIVMSIESDADTVSIKISDNGVGIPAGALERIFDLFYQQYSPEEAEAMGGMGVGLYLVKHIVEAHAGTIEVSSDGKGSGSQFVVRLPLAGKVIRTDADGDKIMFKNLRLAFVEDNSDTRSVMAHLLKLRGIEVFEFEDGETAMQEIPELAPDVALIDIGLPGKSGYELAGELRKNSKLENTLLIALTGFGQERDREKATSSGFDDHIVKPTRVDALCKLIAQYLST